MTVRNILVATDFGHASMEALHWAFSIAEPTGAKVHLVHVVAGNSPGVRAQALEGLHELAQLHAKSSALGAYTALTGDPARAVVEHAHEIGVELLVVGLNGGLGAKSQLLGGRAEQILRTARCPVVVVRPSELNLLAIAEEQRLSSR